MNLLLSADPLNLECFWKIHLQIKYERIIWGHKMNIIWQVSNSYFFILLSKTNIFKKGLQYMVLKNSIKILRDFLLR